MIEDIGYVVQRVVDWACQRNLILGSYPMLQQPKLSEEVGEVITELNKRVVKGDITDFCKEIGDVMVVVIIIAKMYGIDIDMKNADLCYNDLEVEPDFDPTFPDIRAYCARDFQHNSGVVADCVANLYGIHTQQFNEIHLHDQNVIDALDKMTDTCCYYAALYGSSGRACLESAYDKIKDRKGQMIGGVFYKESDL